METINQPGSSAPGTQTLVRGLNALLLIAEGDGVSLTEIASAMGIHRTIAYRLVTTLAQYRFVARGDDGRYRMGVRTLTLAGAVQHSLAHAREVALPMIRALADDISATVVLMAKEGAEAAAIGLALPRTTTMHLAFHEGSTHPLDRGSAGPVLLASLPAVPGEPERVALARERGWDKSFGEVEEGAYSVSAVVHTPPDQTPVCITAITTRRRSVDIDKVLETARALSDALQIVQADSPGELPKRVGRAPAGGGE